MVHGEQVALQPVGVAEGLRAERAEEQPRSAGRPQRGDGRLAQLLGQRHSLQLGQASVEGAAAVHGGHLGQAAGVVQRVGDDSPVVLYLCSTVRKGFHDF